MPASQGEWVDSAGRALAGGAMFDTLEFVGLPIGSAVTLGSAVTFASSCAIFRWRSVRPARTAASSEVTPVLV